jgi:hypothetical protein
MYKLEMKTKHKAIKKGKCNSKAPPSPVTIIARKTKPSPAGQTQPAKHHLRSPSSPEKKKKKKKKKKEKQNKTCFFFISSRPNPTGRPPSPVKTQPKKSILMPQNSFLMPQNWFLGSKTKI